MSRRLRYQVAVSLDGFIAGPNGEHDRIVMDPAIDFAALFKEFDTVVMGRKTSDIVARVRLNHWSERGRATSVANSDALGRPRRSVPALGGNREVVERALSKECHEDATGPSATP